MRLSNSCKITDIIIGRAKVKHISNLIPNTVQVQSSLHLLSNIDPNDELIISEVEFAELGSQLKSLVDLIYYIFKGHRYCVASIVSRCVV